MPTLPRASARPSIIQKPSLPNDAHSRIWEIIEEVENSLRAFAMGPLGSHEALSSFRRDGSLSAGSAGIALFYGYLASATKDARASDICVSLLERAIEAVAKLPASEGLYDGFTGVAWSIHHLSEFVLPGVAADDTCDQIDEYLADWLSEDWHSHQVDLISGLTGIGVYSLSRLPRETARICLEQVINRLALASVRDDVGRAWTSSVNEPWAPNRPWVQDHYFNVGMAHGLAGVIGFLGQAAAAGNTRAPQLLNEVSDWLFHHQLAPTESSRFPALVEPGVAPTPSIPGWCYGELGIATALLVAGTATGDTRLSRFGIDVAKQAAERPLDSRTAIRDPALCHGTTGMAHMFRRFYEFTGDSSFENAAWLWLDRALRFRRPGQGFGGYLFFRNTNGESVLESDPAFLVGASGLGISLLAWVTALEPKWDRVMLMSPSVEKGATQD